MPGVLEVVLISKPYKLASREFHPDSSTVTVGDVVIGGPEPVIMAGPCSVEDEEQMVSTARAVKAAGAKILRGGAFKPRTSPYSFRGMGIEGLELLDMAKQETGLPIITEVMSPRDVDIVAQYADILQIGARNMQNYNLLDEVGETKKPVMVKRGLAASYEEWLLAAEYVMAGGNEQVMLWRTGNPGLRAVHPVHVGCRGDSSDKASEPPADRRRPQPQHWTLVPGDPGSPGRHRRWGPRPADRGTSQPGYRQVRRSPIIDLRELQQPDGPDSRRSSGATGRGQRLLEAKRGPDFAIREPRT